jgi:hypothetical protein
MADRTGGVPSQGARLATGRDDPPPEVRIARLRAALGRERARGRAGHWTYDLARHLALAKQLKDAERALRAPPGRH